MSVSNIISLLSGVALFLFGMELMGDGLKKVAGSKLELILYRLTSSPLKSVLLGTGVTAVIQSSSATSVMVVGFVNSGMMKVRQAIGIIMGAIIGTSVTGWILCLSDVSGSGWISLLSTATLTGVVAVVGIILRMFCKDQTKKQVGGILLGFAVLMFGMSTMSGSVAPLQDSPTFISFFTKFSNPLLGILFGMLITCVLQSASASVGILQALSMTGVITFSAALPLIMGIGIGAAVPVLISAIGANTNGKRTAFIYLMIDFFGVVIWASVFYAINAFVHFSFMGVIMSTVTIAALNTVFRIATVIVLFPFIKLLEKTVCAIFKDSPEDNEMAEMDRLEERFIEHPALALEQSRLVLCSMAHKAQNNLDRAFHLLDEFSQEEFDRVVRKEDVIDRYEDKLGSYLVQITQKELTANQNKEISKFLHTISDYERIADHAVNIAEAAKEKNDKNIEFSENAKHELSVLKGTVMEILSTTIHAFEEDDLDLAYHIEPLEELIDGYCDEIKMNHVHRVQTGECSLNQGFIFNDLLTDYERIGDHCSNVAVAMIEINVNAFDTHEYINELVKNRTASFEQYFEEYRKKFAL